MLFFYGKKKGNDEMKVKTKKLMSVMCLILILITTLPLQAFATENILENQEQNLIEPRSIGLLTFWTEGMTTSWQTHTVTSDSNGHPQIRFQVSRPCTFHVSFGGQGTASFTVTEGYQNKVLTMDMPRFTLTRGTTYTVKTMYSVNSGTSIVYVYGVN